MLVTLVGYDIMKREIAIYIYVGQRLRAPHCGTAFFMTSALCEAFSPEMAKTVTSSMPEGGKVKLLRGASDAALMPYHVGAFQAPRYGSNWKEPLSRCGKNLAGPSSSLGSQYLLIQMAKVDEEGSLARAANLIGQLGDPHYLQKANALYYEFEEVGMNKQLGYACPCRFNGFISTILLQQRFAIRPNGYPVSECHVERAHVDRGSLQQRLPGRTRAKAIGTAALSGVVLTCAARF